MLHVAVGKALCIRIKDEGDITESSFCFIGLFII